MGNKLTISVHYRALKKRVTIQTPCSIDDLQRHIYDTFDSNLNQNNAIIIYFDDQHRQRILDHFPVTETKTSSFRILTVNTGCAICQQPFGIRQDDGIFECPTENCGEQYCGACVELVQRANADKQLFCLGCKNMVELKQNDLIDRHLVWPSFMKRYGEENLDALFKDKETTSNRKLLHDIRIRRVHLQSRLNSFLHFGDQVKGDTLVHFSESMIRKLSELEKKIIESGHNVKSKNLSLAIMNDEFRIETEKIDRLYRKALEIVESSPASSSKRHLESLWDDYKKNYNFDMERDFSSMGTLNHLQSCAEQQRRLLEALLFELTVLIETQPSNDKIRKRTEELAKRLDTLHRFSENLTVLYAHAKRIRKSTERYLEILCHQQFPHIRISKFALIMEELRHRTEQLEHKTLLPKTFKIAQEWQKEPGELKNFKPKIPKLFEVIESDLDQIFATETFTQMPLRIGLIGATSVGKTSIAASLGDFHDNDDMIGLDRTTFNFLQCLTSLTYRGQKIPALIIDIEGAIDEEKDIAHGNYLSIVQQVNCDVYLMIYDREFTAHNQVCLDFIQHSLYRKCFIVRSKADQFFCEQYQDLHKKSFKSSTNDRISVVETIQTMHQRSQITADRSVLKDTVYLIAAKPDERLTGKDFISFDKEKLLKALFETVTDRSRIFHIMGVCFRASHSIINTCFRRLYVASSLRHQVGAGFASTIPYLDLLVQYFGKESITEAFGLRNKIVVVEVHGRETETTFQLYLQSIRFYVEKKHLKSNYYEFLSEVKENQTHLSLEDYSKAEKRFSGTRQEAIGSSRAASYAVATGGAVGLVLDDVLRVVAPAATGATKIVSVAGIVVGAVITPVICVWAAYSTGQKMKQHLNDLCDDSIIVLYHFIYHLCESKIALIRPIGIPESDDDDDYYTADSD